MIQYIEAAAFGAATGIAGILVGVAFGACLVKFVLDPLEKRGYLDWLF